MKQKEKKKKKSIEESKINIFKKKNHPTNQSDCRLLTIWKCYGMGPNPMAALMANCVSEEGFKIYKFLLFLCNTNISYRLKNMLEPD